jgi:hypothetical protein
MSDNSTNYKTSMNFATVVWIVLMVLAFASIWSLPMPISINPFVPSFWGVIGIIFFTWLWATGFGLAFGLVQILFVSLALLFIAKIFRK